MDQPPARRRDSRRRRGGGSAAAAAATGAAGADVLAVVLGSAAATAAPVAAGGAATPARRRNRRRSRRRRDRSAGAGAGAAAAAAAADEEAAASENTEAPVSGNPTLPFASPDVPAPWISSLSTEFPCSHCTCSDCTGTSSALCGSVTAFCIGGQKTPLLAFVMPRQSLQRIVAIPLRIDDGIREKYVPRVARQKVKSALRRVFTCVLVFLGLYIVLPVCHTSIAFKMRTCVDCGINVWYV